MTACSWLNVGLLGLNGVGVVVNVRLARLLWRALDETIDRYLPGASVLSHIKSDKKEQK